MSNPSIYTYTVTNDGARMDYADGTYQSFSRDTLTPAIQDALMWHGLKQKLADGAAMSRNPETGRPASVADKIYRMMGIGERLLAGQWRAVSEGGGNEGGLLLAALVRLYPAKTREDLVEYLKQRSEAEKAKLRTSSRIAPIIDLIRAERGRDSGIDADALLEELED